MVFSRIWFLLLLPIQWAFGSIAEPLFDYGEQAPDWVKERKVPLEPLPFKFLETNLQYLLFDLQKNWEEKTTYFHYAIKAVSQEGVKDISRVQIDFNADYQQLKLHTVRIWRDQTVIDRLSDSRQEILQRELQLENNLYHGGLTFVCFLDDVQKGDILEFAYSLVGEHPVSLSCFSDLFLLQSTVFVNQIYRRLLIDPKISLAIKNFNQSVEPISKDLSLQLREWTWQVDEAFPCFYEPNQPSWHFPIGCVQLSQYQTWQQIVEQLLPLYLLPADLISDPGPEITQLVKMWEGLAIKKQEQALLALRYVQDQIHYFGFEEGMRAFQPSDPRLILKRRYGDCKDKTFLLHALLHFMGISSTPILVNLNRGEILNGFLPTPFAFDHIILRIDLEGRAFFVDPTWTHQGGSLETNSFPSFHWGLALDKETVDLMELPKATIDQPIEIKTTFSLLSEDFADLTVVRKFQGAKADVIRNYLKWLGHVYLSAFFMDDVEKIYGTVSFLAKTLEDDRDQNIIVLTDSYRISTQRKGKKRILKIRPFVTNGYLPKGINPDRISPLSLTYPLWVVETIHVENPYAQWQLSFDSSIQDHEAFHYSRMLKKQGRSADLKFEIQYLKDHVPKHAIQDFWTLIEEIDQDSLFKIEIASSNGREVSFFENLNFVR